MTDYGVPEAMTWALSVLHAAVLKDEDAVAELVTQRMSTAIGADDALEQVWTMLVSLVEAGVVYALLFSDAVKVEPKEMIAMVGNHASMWEADSGLG
jgi:hypothetical protein